MGIRVFAFDMDGTILTPDKLVTPRAHAALDALAQKGVTWVPTTGRSDISLIEGALGRTDFPYLVMSNGALVWERASNAFLYRRVLTNEQAVTLVRRLMGPNVVVYLNLDDGVGTRLGWSQSAEQVSMVHDGDFTWDEPLVDDLAEKVAQSACGVRKVGVRFAPGRSEKDYFALADELGLTAAVSGTRNVEFAPAGVNKAVGLAALCKRLGCTMADVCAIGDSGNDAQMLAAVGLGVAMGNATQEVLALADEVTRTNADDGLARFVEQRLL